MELDNSSWYIWTVNHSKIDYIYKHISEHVPQIEEVLFPTYTKEYRSRTGKVKKKKVPLYASYLFLRYEYDPRVVYKLKDSPFIKDCLGRCSGADLEYVKTVKEVEHRNESKDIRVGDKVIVNGGPLKGFEGIVSMVSGGKVVVCINILGRSVDTELLLVDVDYVSKG